MRNSAGKLTLAVVRRATEHVNIVGVSGAMHLCRRVIVAQYARLRRAEPVS